MKKIFVLILLAVLLVGTISAFEFDNVKSYNEETKTIKIKNAFGLGKDISTITLDSPQTVYVIRGEDRKVAEFTINNYGDYDSVFNKMEFHDIKKTVKKFDREFTYKYKKSLGFETINDYERVCEIIGKSKNGTNIEECHQALTGTHQKEIFEWVVLDISKQLPKGEITLGVFTDVYANEYIEWIPTLFGVEIKEWAEWAESLNVGLFTYHNFTSLTDSIGNHDLIVTEGAPVFNSTNCLLNDCGWSSEGNNWELADHSDFDFEGYSNGTINIWVYKDDITATPAGGLLDKYAGSSQGWYLQFLPDETLFMDYLGTDLAFSTTVNNSWFMLTVRANGTTVCGYINGTIDNCVARFNTATSEVVTGVGSNDLGTNDLTAQLDELGFWNRSLSDAEITQLYNGGSGITYGEVSELEITLLSPEDNAELTTSNVSFSANISDSGSLGIQNVTLEVIYPNGTLFYNETNSSGFEGVYNWTNITISDGDWNWSVSTYDDDNESYESDARSFSFIPFEVDAESHESEVLETSRQEFEINVTSSVGYTISNGRLVYNGTAYENADKISIDSDSFQLIHTINIPSGTAGFGSENRTFYWNISVTNEDTGSTTAFTTDDYNQTVNELVFQLCGGAATEPVLNFTMFDEETGDGINTTANPSTFQATFNLGADYLNLNKNYSINNASVDTNEFDFCTSNSSDFFYVDMESFYTAANYVNKNYFLNNASLNESATAEISLYLLNESNALEFFISVEQDLSPITEATINIKKFFVGEGVYKTVEIDETSSDTGEFTAYLSLDGGYTFTISKNGIVLGTVTKTAYCKQAPCELTLSLRSGLADIYEQFSAFFGQNVNYNLVWNPNTKIVIFDFIDTTGLANYFRMKIWKGNYNTASDLVFDKTLYTSSGTITANMSNYTDGDFTTWVYVSRSPELPIDFIKFAMKEVIGKFGLLGLFFAFLLVVTIIFGLSFSPPILVFSIPLALTISTFMGISLLSGTGIVIIYILAVIAAFAMKGQ